MQYSINDTAKLLRVSPNTVRRRLASGVLHGNKVGNQWLIDIPDTMEIPPEPALAMATEGALVEELRTQIANANDRINFLEGHISQLTNALPPAPMAPKPRSWWGRMWRGE
jgi:excisionase family DNA binding protein